MTVARCSDGGRRVYLATAPLASRSHLLCTWLLYRVKFFHESSECAEGNIPVRHNVVSLWAAPGMNYVFLRQRSRLRKAPCPREMGTISSESPWKKLRIRSVTFPILSTEFNRLLSKLSGTDAESVSWAIAPRLVKVDSESTRSIGVPKPSKPRRFIPMTCRRARALSFSRSACSRADFVMPRPHPGKSGFRDTPPLRPYPR